MLWRIGIVLAVLGIVLGVFGINEWRLSSVSSATPEKISLQNLIARGPEGNANIVLTNYQLGDKFLYITGKRSSSWSKVYNPVFPAAGPPIPGRNPIAGGSLQALVLTTRAKNEGELHSRIDKQELPAMVINKISSLGSDDKRLLEQHYPGTNFDRVLIIEEGRTPSGGALMAISLIGAVILVLGGAGLILLAVMGGVGQSAPPRKKKKKKRPVEELEEVEDDEEEDRPRRKRREVEAEDEEEEERPRRRRPAVEEEEEDEPRPRRKRRVDDD